MLSALNGKSWTRNCVDMQLGSALVLFYGQPMVALSMALQ
jgi:hypothetical protein